MHPSVYNAWKSLNEPLEGDEIPYPYLDIKGLVTVWTGNLMEDPSGKTNYPPDRCLRLPWYIDDRLATVAEIVADWRAVNNAPHLAKMHHKYAAPYTRIRLHEQGGDTLLFGQLTDDFDYLKRNHFPDLASYCADEQMAILSIAWACGANWPAKFPKTKKAILARDLAFAAAEGVISSGVKGTPSFNPGVIPRNHANRRCFLNAERVERLGLDRTKLYWPDEAANVCVTCGRPL